MPVNHHREGFNHYNSDMNHLYQLTDNLRRLMKQAGIESQAQLSHRSGVSQTHISNLMRHAKSPTLDILVKLARALGVPPWQLLASGALAKHGINGNLDTLMADYLACDTAGRQTIVRVAAGQAAAARLPPEGHSA